MKDKLKVIGLKLNGEVFDASKYSINDHLDALIIYKDDIASIRIYTYGVSYQIESNIKTIEPAFLEFLENLKNGVEGCPRNFMLSKYQEYLYPFYISEPNDNKIAPKNVNNIHFLLDWCSNNMNTNERIEIILTSFNQWENKLIIAKSEDIGIIVDYYDEDDELESSYTYYFEDYEEDPSEKMYPIACGLTSDVRPLLVFRNPHTNKEFTKWYHTTFFKRDDALKFLKDTFKDGVLIEDLDELWTYIQFINNIDLNKTEVPKHD